MQLWLAAAALLIAQSPPPAPPATGSSSPAERIGQLGTAEQRSRLAECLEAYRRDAGCPGVCAGFALADGSTFAIASGLADLERKTALKTDGLMLSGSVGKTYVAAVALALVHERALDLDARIETYLGKRDWFARLPNARDITVRMLMNHTSGLVRYEFKEAFARDLTAQPDKAWKPEELLAYVFDTTAPFPAGERFEYSDTNYIVLGIVLEQLGGAPLYEQIARRVLKPLALEHTVPSNTRTIAGLCQGYAGANNPFGGTDAMMVDGQFAINPQFEWAGGGFASTAEDLARWGKALYEGRAFDASLMPQVLDGVEAPMLGRGARYGLGVIVRDTPRGRVLGHSGFFPGYSTDLRYYVELRLAIAVQVNTSDPQRLARPPGALFESCIATLVGAAVK